MNQVPLSGRVIFSDWHGVLSRDPFWTSIRLSATHPLHEQLEAGTTKGVRSRPQHRQRVDEGPWLAVHGVSFSDAVLIDDRSDNCAAFTSQGGTAIHWKMGTSDISEVTRRLRQWLDTDPRTTPDPPGAQSAS